MPPLRHAEGAVGAPPPDAPREVTQPLTADAGGIVAADGSYESPRERARRNEKSLEPLTYGKVKDPSHADAVAAAQKGQLDPFYDRLKVQGAKPVTTVPTRRRIVRVAPPPVPEPARITAVPPSESAIDFAGRSTEPTVPASLISGNDDGGLVTASGNSSNAPASVESPELVDTTLSLGPGDEDIELTEHLRDAAHTLAAKEAEDVADLLDHAPAASNTDSPSRGIPTPSADPGKQITGGFTDMAELQYFALEGTEVLVLANKLIDDLKAILQNDMRFGEHLVYPRLTVRAVLEVTGFAEDNEAAFAIDRILPATHPLREQTPLELARTLGDEVCFVVIAERQEVDEAGETIAPPDALRDELGLKKPRKSFVRTKMGYQVADVKV